MSFFNIVAATNEDTVVATYEPSKVRSDSYQSEAELEKEAPLPGTPAYQRTWSIIKIIRQLVKLRAVKK